MECLAPTQNAMQWPEMIAKERERAYMGYILSIIQSSKKIEEGGSGAYGREQKGDGGIIVDNGLITAQNSSVTRNES